MEHKVLMLGGRRAGKSTILSSILHELHKTPGSVCTIDDITDYTHVIRDKTGNEYKLKPLKEKRLEIMSFIKDHDRLNMATNKHINFVIDMAKTNAAGSYDLLVSATGKNANTPKLNLRFYDVPGEWMVSTSEDHPTLKSMIKESDIFIIAIDTPFLMQDDEDLNDVYNRIDEITSALTSSISIADSADWKQIILCPVKCEKWTNSGKSKEVIKKVCQAYKRLMNTWVNNENVHIWIMPINTAGCVESTELRPAKLFFKDKSDRTGTPCSYDELTGIIIDKDGNHFNDRDVERIEDDKMWSYEFKSNYVDIPLSWYHCNGKPFSTRFCEQPAFHILKFIVEKEENVNKEKARQEQMSYERKNWFEKFLTILFQPTFGHYLPVWRGVIDELDRLELIKKSDDDIKRVKEFIN